MKEVCDSYCKILQSARNAWFPLYLVSQSMKNWSQVSEGPPEHCKIIYILANTISSAAARSFVYHPKN